MNYYNEFDPKAAAWLQQLIDDKQIPNGHVDSRSITEVQPSDLAGFSQCHFFAGIGGWSLALRLAGWPEDRPVWTASLPCQPFSTAGRQRGTEDERHLAPIYLELVRQCKPPVQFGEQVASKLARTEWLPGIRMELEALGYSFGAADLCAPCAGEIGEGRIVRGDQESWERIIIGHPHIRQRLYWVAQSCDIGTGSFSGEVAGRGRKPVDAGTASLRQAHGTTGASGVNARGASCADGMADSDSERRSRIDTLLRPEEGRAGTGEVLEAAGRGTDGGMADSNSLGKLREPRSGDEGTGQVSEPLGRGLLKAGGNGAHSDLWLPDTSSEGFQGHGGSGDESVSQGRQGENRYRPEDSTTLLIPCRDGKTRRTESGIFPLVDGVPRGMVPSGDPDDPHYTNATPEARAMRLKGYGNAIVPPLAALFITSYREATE